MAPRPEVGVAELAQRVEELEKRVWQLEDRLASGATAAPSMAEATALPQIAGDLDLQDAERLVPLLGKALLALAGAYLFRALTMSSLAPPWVGVTLALAYAVFWMVLATRLGASNQPASAVYMTTAVLALSPMLWEATVRFRIMSTGAAAAAISGFVVLSLLLSWKAQYLTIAWLAAAAGSVTALALAAGTDDLAPFCTALLAITATLEVAACRDLWLGPRGMAAVAADLIVLWLVYIHSLGPKLPDADHPIPQALFWAAPTVLLAIYAAGVGNRTLVRKLEVTIFEVFQLLAAFSLFIFAALRGPGSPLMTGALLVICGTFCYAVSFIWLVKAPQVRNLYVYSLFGLTLTLCGTAFFIPRTGMPIVWALAAAGFAVLAAGSRGLTAALHGLAFLAAAGLGSGLAGDTFSTLLRDGTKVALTPATLFAFAAMIAAYVLLRGIPRSIVATMVAWVTAAWAASILLSELPASADAAWRAAVRTVLLLVAAVLVAVIGRRWQRPELYWLVPGAMVIALYRLVAADLRVGRPETLFLSLTFYGGALLALSRLMRGWQHDLH